MINELWFNIIRQVFHAFQDENDFKLKKFKSTHVLLRSILNTDILSLPEQYICIVFF